MAPITASTPKDESEVTKQSIASLEAAIAFNEAYKKATCNIEDEEVFLWGDGNKDGYHG